jgi:hypothetical protein
MTTALPTRLGFKGFGVHIGSREVMTPDPHAVAVTACCMRVLYVLLCNKKWSRGNMGHIVNDESTVFCYCACIHCGGGSGNVTSDPDENEHQVQCMKWPDLLT